MIRFFDIFFSGLAIVILFPFMIPVMIGLKLTGEHDIFYRQMRMGRNGKPFGMLKFATMLRNSPNMAGGTLTQKNDPRILPMGGFLRKTKINELPQLWNIFVGEMSVVGPRPQTVPHFNLYPKHVKQAISTIPPGLTGIGSIVFRDEEDMLDAVEDRTHFYDTVIAPFKGALEVWYAAHRNLWTYFALSFMTGWAVLSPRTRIYSKVFKDLPQPPKELQAIL